MSGGILSRLRRRRQPAAEEPIVRVPEVVPVPEPVPEPEPEPVAAAPEPELEPEPEPEPVAAAPPPAPEPAPAASRQLPSFRPVAPSAPSEVIAEPLSVTLSEAIELVQGAGGDVIELRFLRRELDRRKQEGSEPPDLWPRIETAVGGRLRRVGKLVEGQELALLRDN
jgi:hypothetical protein